MKQLYRSRTNRQIAGICGGFGKYYAVDPTILRVGLIVFVLITGIFPGVIAYFIVAMVIPNEP